MVVLGLILVLAAAAAGVVLIVENSGRDHMVTISAFGGAWRADAFWLAVIGAVILVVAVLGLSLIRGGSRRSLRRRQERRQLERENAALADRVRHTEPVAEPVNGAAPGAGAGAPASYDPDNRTSYVPAPPVHEEEPRRTTP